MTKLKYLRFNGTNKRKINSNKVSNINKTRKIFFMRLFKPKIKRIITQKKEINKKEREILHFKKYKQNNATLKKIFIKPNNVMDIQNKEHVEKLEEENLNTLNKKQTLFKNYLKDIIKRKTLYRNITLDINRNKNKNITPIYNSYVPGSGVGASSISLRRYKKRFA